MTAVGKKVYAVTVRKADGHNQVVNVAVDGSVRAAMDAAEQAVPGSEAIGSTQALCVIHAEV